MESDGVENAQQLSRQLSSEGFNAKSCRVLRRILMVQFSPPKGMRKALPSVSIKTR
jgi:hypothetical protein